MNFTKPATAALVALILAGCGGYNGKPVTSSGTANGRWVNHTSMPDAQFFPFMEMKYTEALLELYKPQVLADGKTPARPFTTEEMLKMQNATPRNWSIRGLESVPADEVNNGTVCRQTPGGCHYTDPTPFIPCHSGGNCYAYESDGEISIPDAYPNFVGPWELDNLIMTKAGVDIGPR